MDRDGKADSRHATANVSADHLGQKNATGWDNTAYHRIFTWMPVRHQCNIGMDKARPGQRIKNLLNLASVRRTGCRPQTDDHVTDPDVVHILLSIVIPSIHLRSQPFLNISETIESSIDPA